MRALAQPLTTVIKWLASFGRIVWIRILHAAAKREGTMAKILLVDDEEYIRLLYSQELSEEGHLVTTLAQRFAQTP